MTTRRSSVTLSFVLSAAFIACDQALKTWSSAHLRLYHRVPILGQTWLSLTQVLNRGIMGDRFSNIPEGYIEPYTRYMPSAVWAALLVVAIARFARARSFERAAYSLMLAGGASNLWDHWHSAVVIDTFQIYSGGGQYLPFNLADVGLVSGGALLLAQLARELVASFRAPVAPRPVSADPARS